MRKIMIRKTRRKYKYRDLYVKLLQLTGLFITILFIIFPAAFCNLCVSFQNKYNSA